jgi:hypothetical protein
MTSTIKVNNIQNQCGANIINENSNTITIGASGDTIALASGASQSGFGREGSVDWQTSIKTATFTAASGEGYFCNTSGGAFTVNLPSSPSVGDIVAIKDYGSSFGTNNLTIGRGGSNMNGSASDSVRSTNNESLTLVYADATKGWLAVEEGTGFVGETFITASGGTITCCGDYKIHTFTGPGTFTVCSLSSSPAENIVSYMVVAGGGGGGASPSPGSGDAGGGGGAGGFREFKNTSDPYTASPLNGNPGGTSITVTATSFPITVGAGGAAGPQGSPGSTGVNSVFSTVTSAGGGAGRHNAGPGNRTGTNGGSGGGPSGGGTGMSGGVGNTPPVSPPQGQPGSSHNGSPDGYGGAGGGAGGAGQDGPGPVASAGGAAVTTSINGTATTFAGGGAGGGSPSGPGGQGGGQASEPARGGGGPGGNAGSPGNPGSDNTGGGGGGGGGTGASGAAGGSGIVIIRYKFQ